jgi:ABC-type branched-chain amino acid transport systems, periplasmic component
LPTSRQASQGDGCGKRRDQFDLGKGTQVPDHGTAPVDSAAIGALDLAARNGLKKVAIINQDALLPKAVANTTNALARDKGLDVVAFETYPAGTWDFSAILKKVQDAAPDLVIVAAVRLDDHVAIIREMKAMNLDTKMVSSLPYGLLPEFLSATRQGR